MALRPKRRNISNDNDGYNDNGYDDDGFYNSQEYSNYNDQTNVDAQYYNNNEENYVDPNYVEDNRTTTDDSWNTNEDDYYPKPKTTPKKSRFVRPRPKHTSTTSFKPRNTSSSTVPNVPSIPTMMTNNGNNNGSLGFESLAAAGLTAAASSAGVLPNGMVGGIGQQMIGSVVNQGFNKLPPGILSFGYYKYYFRVDNDYVLKKLTRLILPFLKMNISKWKRKRIDEVSNDNRAPPPKIESAAGYSYQPPLYDLNAPDGYLPLMAIITYIVIMGFVVGTQSSSSSQSDIINDDNISFSPQVLIATGSSAFVMLIIEVLLMKIGFYLIGSVATPPYWLDIVCYAGYKLVFVTINLIINLIFPSLIIYYIISITTGIIAAIFMIQTLRPYFRDLSQFASGPLMDIASSNEPKQTRKIFLGVVGIAQILFIQLMGRYTSV